MESFRLAVDLALKGTGPFARPVAEIVLEIAYLTMSVDGELRDEELDAFSMIAAVMFRLDHKKLDDEALRAWLERFSEKLDDAGIQERLEQLVAKLGDDKPAKLASYRVACLMALSDFDSADREFEFDLQLIASLGLTQEEADQVVAEVNEALTPPEAS